MNIIYLKYLLSKFSCFVKNNDINMHLEKWGGRGKKELIQIPSVGHLKYDRFKQNIKQDNFVEHTLKTFPSNSDDNHYSLSIINLCRYFCRNLRRGIYICCW